VYFVPSWFIYSIFFHHNRNSVKLNSKPHTKHGYKNPRYRHHRLLRKR
jgi:hypothetical protein